MDLGLAPKKKALPYWAKAFTSNSTVQKNRPIRHSQNRQDWTAEAMRPALVRAPGPRKKIGPPSLNLGPGVPTPDGHFDVSPKIGHFSEFESPMVFFFGTMTSFSPVSFFRTRDWGRSSWWPDSATHFLASRVLAFRSWWQHDNDWVIKPLTAAKLTTEPYPEEKKVGRGSGEASLPCMSKPQVPAFAIGTRLIH